MRTQIITISLLLTLLSGCSKPEDGETKKPILEDRAASVSHAKPEQPAQITPTNKPSALDRRLREGAQEKGQGLGRLDRKRGE